MVDSDIIFFDFFLLFFSGLKRLEGERYDG